jgi:hypothetical protein
VPVVPVTDQRVAEGAFPAVVFAWLSLRAAPIGRARASPNTDRAVSAWSGHLEREWNQVYLEGVKCDALGLGGGLEVGPNIVF